MRRGRYIQYQLYEMLLDLDFLMNGFYNSLSFAAIILVDKDS